MDRNQYTLMLIIAIAVVAVLVTYFFKYTKFGKYTKAIGANEVVAEQSGVNTTKWKVFAYMAFGATVAIGSFIMLTRTGSAGKGTGTGFAMDVMICLDPWRNASFRRNEIQSQQCTDWNFYLCTSQQ